MEVLGTGLTLCIVLTTTLAAIGTADENSTSTVFNVLNYGAIGDGQSDDSNAFLEAWEVMCKGDEGNVSNCVYSPPKLVIPEGKTFKLKPVHFQGPCNCESVQVQVSGNITAPMNKSEWSNCSRNSWILFSDVSNLIINGSGMIDGQGENWWEEKDMSYDTDLPFSGGDSHCNKPTALRIQNCSNSEINGLNHVNSPRNHIAIATSYNVTLSNLNITAPESSPNTDGINTYNSAYVIIVNTTIGTGDDCIAIKENCSHINIIGVTCGPGHGISVGSLGASSDTVTVEEVLVQNCTLNRTMYGARIKTWQGGSGNARNIHFKDIRLLDARHPILIDQFYCNGRRDCKNETGAVLVSNITYTNVTGTSGTLNAINFNCSDYANCTNIRMDHINITSNSSYLENREVFASCMNVVGTSNCTTPAVPCLDNLQCSCCDTRWPWGCPPARSPQSAEAPQGMSPQSAEDPEVQNNNFFPFFLL